MKEGMKTLLQYKYSDSAEEYVVLCGSENEWATYIRFNNGDYYGRYFFDQKQAVADYLIRINENI